jgi:hypothetical protein
VVADSSFFSWPRLIHLDHPFIHGLAVQGDDCLLGFTIILHFDEGEPSGAARFPIHYELRTLYYSVGLEKTFEILFGGSEAEVANKNIFHWDRFNVSNRNSRAVVPFKKVLYPLLCSLDVNFTRVRQASTRSGGVARLKSGVNDARQSGVATISGTSKNDFVTSRHLMAYWNKLLNRIDQLLNAERLLKKW